MLFVNIARDDPILLRDQVTAESGERLPLVKDIAAVLAVLWPV
jgi:hypothetical protein